MITLVTARQLSEWCTCWCGLFAGVRFFCFRFRVLAWILLNSFKSGAVLTASTDSHTC